MDGFVSFRRSARLAFVWLWIASAGIADTALGACSEPQWILQRGSSRATWESLAGALPGRLRELRGTESSYAWYCGRRPALSREFRVQPNHVYRVISAGDPDLAKSWGLENTGQAISDGGGGTPGKDIGALPAWAIEAGLNPTLIAVIDSGIDLEHPELKANLWRNPKEIPGNHLDDEGNGFVDDVHGYDFAGGSGNAQDDNNHGTFCAGVIAAEAENGQGSRGVVRRAKLMAVKFLDASGTGTTAAAIEAIRYAVNNGAKLVNASWGGGKFDQALYDTVKWAGDRGVLFVAAAGNEGKDNDADPAPTYPASFSLPNVIAVAALDNRDRLASFSSFGKQTVQLAAPGVEIWGPIRGGYKFGDGTSFAAPFVVGVAALVLSRFPSMGIPALRERLLMTSDVIGYYEKEKLQTSGRVHALNAIRDSRPPRPVAPVQWSTFIESAGTAHPYVNKTSLRLEFRHPGATHVRVRFRGFDTEACCDGVVLKDARGRLVASYAGNRGDFWSADALGDTVYVEFASDYSMVAHGFDVDASQASSEPSPWD